jgi:hypothetical protein
MQTVDFHKSYFLGVWRIVLLELIVTIALILLVIEYFEEIVVILILLGLIVGVIYVAIYIYEYLSQNPEDILYIVGTIIIIIIIIITLATFSALQNKKMDKKELEERLKKLEEVLEKRLYEKERKISKWNLLDRLIPDWDVRLKRKKKKLEKRLKRANDLKVNQDKKKKLEKRLKKTNMALEYLYRCKRNDIENEIAIIARSKKKLESNESKENGKY